MPRIFEYAVKSLAKKLSNHTAMDYIPLRLGMSTPENLDNGMSKGTSYRRTKDKVYNQKEIKSMLTPSIRKQYDKILKPGQKKLDFITNS